MRRKILVYDLFNEGLLFVRRSNKYWAAIPPDLVIEQVLMASLKNFRSGITHGRGLDETQRLNWLYSRPAFAHIKYELDKLFNHSNSYVNKELTNNRIKADSEAILKMLEYLKMCNPFTTNSNDLVDISTGMSYPKANAHKALETGNKILKKMDGVAVIKYIFRKCDRIKMMGEKVMVGDEEIVIDPQLFFQRMIILADVSDITREILFRFELSLYPTSLFNKKNRMRATDKAKLKNHLVKEAEPESTPDLNELHIEFTVLDMGFFLEPMSHLRKELHMVNLLSIIWYRLNHFFQIALQCLMVILIVLLPQSL